MFVPARQTVSVLTNVPDSTIYANGEFVQVGQQANFSVKRNQTTQIMVTAKGYFPAYRQIAPDLNTFAILDIIGGVIWLVPFIGLVFPGSKSLDNNNIAIYLIPQENSSQTSH